MSKGIGGIKGYHSGGAVTHTHGSKKNKEKKKALQAMTSNEAYQGSGTSKATQAKKKMGQSYKDMYSSKVYLVQLLVIKQVKMHNKNKKMQDLNQLQITIKVYIQ